MKYLFLLLAALPAAASCKYELTPLPQSAKGRWWLIDGEKVALYQGRGETAVTLKWEGSMRPAAFNVFVTSVADAGARLQILDRAEVPFDPKLLVRDEAIFLRYKLTGGRVSLVIWGSVDEENLGHDLGVRFEPPALALLAPALRALIEATSARTDADELLAAIKFGFPSN